MEKRLEALPISHLSEKLSLQPMRTGLWTDDSGFWAPDKASPTLSFRIASRSVGVPLLPGSELAAIYCPRIPPGVELLLVI